MAIVGEVTNSHFVRQRREELVAVFRGGHWLHRCLW